MAFLVPVGAGFISGVIRVYETLLPINNNAERYLKGEINFEKATDHIVKKVHIYLPLTTTKFVCDVVVLGVTSQWISDELLHIRSIFTDLFNCGLEGFIVGIKSFFEHLLMSLQNCSIGLILTHFAKLFDHQKKFVASISMWNFCNVCNQIYFLILLSTTEFHKTIQLELIKYWLECMGIIRAIAESNQINFVKYMNQSCSRQIEKNVNNNQSDSVPVVEWERTKDPDFFETIHLTLDEIFRGGNYSVKVKREIRKIGQREVENEEERYAVTIEPGCPDGKEFRFANAGHRDPVNIPADLVVNIRTKPHDLYERNGFDLIYKTKIPFEDARNGTPLEIPLIDGGTMEYNLYNSDNSNKEIIIDQAGLPNPENGGVRGRLIVKWDIELPDAKIGAEAID